MSAELTRTELWMTLPFVLLLGGIALGPLWLSGWWQRNYPKVSLALGAVALMIYSRSGGASGRILHTAHEYVSFIAMIGSLFIVAGGIHITVRGEATPWTNCLYLLVGALAANVLGTTGASMILIRPWIRMNKYRITAHHVVFFIFIVANAGGGLTPIGDPPLFLGYLKGVPFWWVAKACWPIWATGVGLLLAAFLAVDYANYLKAPPQIREALAEPPDLWRFQGLFNLFFLGVILVSVFINEPPFLRELLMVAAALGSYFATAQSIHQANDFNLHPLKEVAILFAGIFSTMLPALDWLQAHASELARSSATFFYWGCGLLSSVLDNAPTYLAFLSAVVGLVVDPHVVQQAQTLAHAGSVELAQLAGPHAAEIRNTLAALRMYHPDYLAAGGVGVDQIQIACLLGNASFHPFLRAISIGSVFFGANTYIGNGPNFMIKSIADHQKVHSPTFLGYIFKYTLPIMGPVLTIVWLCFFAGS